MTKDEAKAWVLGEVNATSLAEACAAHFDRDEDLDGSRSLDLGNCNRIL